MPAGDYGLNLTAAPFDHLGTAQGFRPWDGLSVGTDLEIGDLIGRQFPTALPPKPAHLALALAAGHFNGHRLEPNDPESFPPILVKGVYTRDYVQVEERTNKKGEVTATVHVEQPKLRLHALRLDRYRFFEPKAGSEPSEARRLEDFNTADVLDRYSRSLTRLMTRQFPPLHSPARSGDQVALPPLPRTPYECQRHAIQAALKLLALGEAPGVLPLFLLRHLLPSGILVHKDDLEIELPPIAEHPVALQAETTADQELVAEYRRLTSKLADQIKRDMFSPLAGKLWGAMLELPSYLDRSTEDLGPFEIRYPEDCGGLMIAEGRAFPASLRTPKERWLVETVRQGLREGRRLLLFLRHTGTAALPKRLSTRSIGTARLRWAKSTKVMACSSASRRLQLLVDGAADRHGKGRAGVVGAGAGGLERALDGEAVDLERGRHLLGHQPQRHFLGGAGDHRKKDGGSRYFGSPGGGSPGQRPA